MAARSGSKTAARAGRYSPQSAPHSMDYAQLAHPVSSLAIISASATGQRDDRHLDHNRGSRMRARYVSDLADQPDDPKVTVELSVASMSITRRIQSTGDTFGQAELLGKVSPPVPLDKGSHAPNVGYAYPRERGCARRFGFHWSRIGQPRSEAIVRGGATGMRKRSSVAWRSALGPSCVPTTFQTRCRALYPRGDRRSRSLR